MRYLASLALLVACSSTTDLPPPSDLSGDKSTDKPTDIQGKGGGNAPTGSGTGGREDQLAVSARPRLQWKRYAALESDLASALELPADALCTEFGTSSCIRDVHLVPLGGYEPFVTGMLEPAAEPLATTPTVVERVVMSACSARVELDRSEHKLFSFDLSGRAPDRATLDALAVSLYRRFHARDPEPLEQAVLAELAVDDAGQPIAADELAKLACFTVGSLSEFFFF